LHSDYKTIIIMTKAEIVTNIANKTGIEKDEVKKVVELFMDEVKTSLETGEDVFLRKFGSFIVKKRAAKVGRNISKKEAVQIPAHAIPAFKPAKTFLGNVREKVKVD